MAERRGPNLVLRRRVGAELRRLRDLAGLTGDDVSASLGWPSSSKLSRIESGKTGVKPADLQRLLGLYQVSAPHRDELTALAEEAGKTGRVPAVAMRLPEEHVTFLQAEADAESIWIWEPQIVPGLLQLDDYTRALLEPWNVRLSRPAAELDRRVEARRLRQEVLNREPPIQIQAVLDESVLRRKVGSSWVMNRQLKHLLDVSASPHIDIRIIRLDGDHIVTTGTFNYLRLRQARRSLPVYDMVNLDLLTGTSNTEDEDEVGQYHAAFRELLESALEPAESRALISAIADDLWV